MDALTLDGVIATIVWAVIGMTAFTAAFFLMVKLTPFSVRKEIEEDQNVALAIVIGSVILGLAWIISAAVGG